MHHCCSCDDWRIKMEEKVLFVDDEENVLSAIRRMLFEETYEQFFASDGDEALELIAKTPVHVIISDMRMPKMDGVTFLEKTCEILPDAIRVILSGQADLYSIKEAINRGGIWRFIAKPWNDEDMKCTIRNALDLYAIQHDRKRLLEVLTQKNAELSSLNAELERRVKERTQIIESQKTLLQQMLEGMNLQTFSDTACKVIAELTGSSHVYFYHTIDQELITQSADRPSVTQKNILKQTYSQKDPFLTDDFLCFPIVHSSTTLGVIGVETHKPDLNEYIGTILSNIIPVLSLALGQFKMIQDAPGMMSAIDDIIDNL